MGYSVMAYLTDAGAIRRVWRSKDATFLKEFCREHEAQLDEIDESFDIEPDQFNAKRALEGIVQGELPDPGANWFVYSYVYEILCAHFGEMYEFPEGELYLQYLDEIDPSCSAFIDIPVRREFPHVLSIEHAHLQDKLAAFLNAKPSDYDDDALGILHGELRGLFDAARDGKHDLVLFNY